MAYTDSMDTLAGAQIAGGQASVLMGNQMFNQHNAILAQALSKYQQDQAVENAFRGRFQDIWWPVESANAQLLQQLSSDSNWSGIVSAAAQDAQSQLGYNDTMRNTYANYFTNAASASLDEIQRAADYDAELKADRANYRQLDNSIIQGAQAELGEEQYMRDTYKPLYSEVVNDSQRDYGEDYARIAGAEQRRAQSLQNQQSERDASRLGVDASKLALQKSKNSIANAANTAAATTNARLQGDQERFQNMVTAIGTREDVSSANRSYAANRMNQASQSPSTVATTAAAQGANTINNGVSQNLISQFNPLSTTSATANLGYKYTPTATVPQYAYLANGGLQGLAQYSDALSNAGTSLTNSYKSSQDASNSTWGDIGSGIGSLAGLAKTGTQIYQMF